MLNAKKRWYDDGNELKVADVFYSIQGEGPFAGEPSLFLRLQGCNLRCPWCDEPDALNVANDGTVGRMPIDDLVASTAGRVQQCGALVITGGEPTMQAVGIRYYLQKLKLALGQAPRITIETNGTQDNGMAALLQDTDLHLVISPKDKPHIKGQTQPKSKLVAEARAIKIVVEVATDLEVEYWKYRGQVNRARRGLDWFYLQPEDGCRAQVLARCVQFVLARPQEARLSMRLHKELGVK